MGSLLDGWREGDAIQVMINGVMLDIDRLVLLDPDERWAAMDLGQTVASAINIPPGENIAHIINTVQAWFGKRSKPIGYAKTEHPLTMGALTHMYSNAVIVDANGKHTVALIDPDSRDGLHRLSKALGKWGYDFIRTPGYFDSERDGSCLAAAIREYAHQSPAQPAIVPTTQESPVPDYERPAPGTWVQVWAQVSKDQSQTHPEDVKVDLESHNADYKAAVRLDRIRLAEEPPPFAEQCSALYQVKGAAMWRCTQTARHPGSHISNAGSLTWPEAETVGYIEER